MLTISRKNWLIPGLLLIFIVGIVWISPAEQSLGNKIKVIYVHVALTWTGILGFTLMGLAGVGIAVQQSPQLGNMTQRLGWLAWGFYLAGHLISLWAMELTWGSIYWEEPKTIMALLVVGIGLVGFAIIDSLNTLRSKGIAYASLAIIVHLTREVPLVLHPADAIRASTSESIQGTTYILFGLFCILGIWLLMRKPKID